MNLEDVDPETFELLVQWLFTQQIELVDDTAVTHLGDLAKLWTLADRCLIPRLQNKVMEKIYSTAKVEWSAGNNKAFLACLFDQAYSGKMGVTPLKRYAIHRVLQCIKKDNQFIDEEDNGEKHEFDTAYDDAMDIVPQ